MSEDNPVRVVEVCIYELDPGTSGFVRAEPASTGRPAGGGSASLHKGAEWIVCLKAARMAAIRSDEERETQAESQPAFEAEVALAAVRGEKTLADLAADLALMRRIDELHKNIHLPAAACCATSWLGKVSPSAAGTLRR